MPKRGVIREHALRGLGCLASIAIAGVAIAGCSGNAGVPRYRTTTPAALPIAGAPRPPDAVRTDFKPLTWTTLAGGDQHFVLGFDESPLSPAAGKALGPVRSRDVVLAEHAFVALRCAWKIVPMGDPRPCFQMNRKEAMEQSEAPIEDALANLRIQAGDAGAGAVRDIRCFAAQSRRPEGRLWCEGTAIVLANNAPAGSPPGLAPVGSAYRSADPSPGAAIDHAPRTPGSRLVLHADGSVGLLGRLPMVASTIGLRYRPYEVGFYIVDLTRDDRNRGLVGIGLSALGRLPLGGSRFDGIAGLSATAVAANGATNPDFDGLYQAFAGIAYQTNWRIAGSAQPFVQLRAGIARGTDLAPKAVPMLELHFGLSTPESR